MKGDRDMILDKHLTFVKGDETAAATTRAICLTQYDLPDHPGTGEPHKGMAPYDGLYLVVIPTEDGMAGPVELQHAEAEDGTFAKLATFEALPSYDNKAGSTLVKAPVPFPAKNWLKLKFSGAKKCNAFLTLGADKGVVIDD